MTNSECNLPRFFGVSFDSTETPPTLLSCIIEFFANAYDSATIYVDTAGNKCWFGTPSTSTGSIPLSGTEWRVHVKERECRDMSKRWRE